MAIVKHKTSKNARYADVLDYYTYKHEESQATGHYEPILDEDGLMIERDNFAVAYITANGEEAEPELWAAACMKTNLLFQKNLNDGDRKNHEYIIAHPAEDKMTVEQLLEEGRAFAKENLAGYDCLIGAHDNHIHITINSVRALQREEQEWMTKKNGQIISSEIEAGGKHQDSPQLRRAMNEWLLQYTKEHGFAVKDNNAIADVHRAERHGSKNEQMKTALIEAAGRSKNMQDLQRIMMQDYRMELKIRGNTFSVLHPESKKAVRLRTLGLEPADLTRRMTDEQYAYTNAQIEAQTLREIEKAEKKKQIEWIKERRQRNNEQAEQAAAATQQLLARRFRASGERYYKQDFQDLFYLIRELNYVEANLKTEAEKLDRMTERWDLYRDDSLDDDDRRKHGGYIRWCGCDPDDPSAFTSLLAEREIIMAQREYSVALREALLGEAEHWKGHNNLNYAENNLKWQKQREQQLKQQLKNVKASRKHLGDIAYNCERSAKKYGKTQNYEKAEYFKQQWFQKAWKEREIKQQIKAVKQKQKEAKEQVREAKKAVKSL